MTRKETERWKKKNTGVKRKISAANANPASQIGTESPAPLAQHQQIPSVDKKPLWTPYLYKLAQLWMKLLSGIASLLFFGVISIEAGQNTAVPSPLVERVHQYPTASILIGSLLVCITILAWFLKRKSASKESMGGPTEPGFIGSDRHVLIATLISTTSVVICFVLISVVLFRPPWCPTSLCPAPKLILQAHSVHDDALEVYLQTVQSSTHLLPDDPTTYTPASLPTAISARRADTTTQEPYRVVIGIHSLQQGRYGLIIEQVRLVLTQVSSTVPYPLHVWMENELRDYHSNIYQALYKGQEASASLPASYLLPDGRTGGHVQLVPGESDELDIQLLSHMMADLHFQVRITYRVINESQEQSITLPDNFEVIFSNASNWFPYHVQDGHLIAST